MTDKIMCMVCGEKEANFIQCEKCMVASKGERGIKFKRLIWKTKGAKCEMCGFDDKNCLSIHHLDKKNHPYDMEYVQVLCLNCHMGKIHKQLRND